MERFKSNAGIEAKKAVLRKEMRRERARIDKEQKRLWDVRIAEQFSESGLIALYDSFYCYYSMEEEADTRELMEELLRVGKRVACPRVEKRGQMKFFYIGALSECCPGFGGICEPVKGTKEARDENALVIVPGLAFSKKGCRLGYGGGYYDRFLSSEQNHKTLALAYDLQIRDDIPASDNDILIDMILTPGGLIICNDKKTEA